MVEATKTAPTRLVLYCAERFAIVLNTSSVLMVKMHLLPQGHFYKCSVCSGTHPSASLHCSLSCFVPASWQLLLVRQKPLLSSNWTS